MRFRNWLLAGTSITLLALAPATAVRAQDANNADLRAAYQAFTADQSDDNRQKLTDACTNAGFQSLDDCIAALSGATPIQPEQPAPAPSSEEAAPAPAPQEEAPAPAPSEEAPAPAPSSEEAPPPPPPSSEEQPAPAAVESSSAEEAVPAPSEQTAPAPSSEEAAPAPSSEEAAPAPAPSSEEAAPAPSSEDAEPTPAPSSEEAPPAPTPSSEQAAPAPSSEAPAPAPSSDQPPANNALADLTAAVDLYNAGVAQLDGGDAGGQAKVDQANATIQQICANGGFTDVAACLAQFGLTLNPLPPKPGEPAASSEQPVTSSEAPPPAASSETPISDLPNASEAVTPSAVEVLPPTVAPSEAAPILDSAKDKPAAPPDQASSQQPPPEPAGPPPQDDKAAQQDITPLTPEQQSTQTDKGKEIDVQAITLAPPPQSDQQPIKVIEPPKPPSNNGAPTPPQNSGVIFQIGVHIVINNPTQERDRFYDPREDKIYYEDLGRGRTRETITRGNGSKIVTVRNKYGDILQRSKILPNGKEILLSTYDPNDDDLNNWRDPGDDLPPLQLNIPASQYILDADSADDADVTSFLEQPPVEKIRRIYTIDEVKRSARLRDSVRRLEVGGLTFDSGKATISRNQVGALSKVADAMQKLLDRNPGEVFLIEGHTDATGSDIANLVLSDNRAATVARILTDFYDIPPENLVTQGYGERFLKVKTDAAEPLNRRVTIKRITPLISVASN